MKQMKMQYKTLSSGYVNSMFRSMWGLPLTSLFRAHTTLPLYEDDVLDTAAFFCMHIFQECHHEFFKVIQSTPELPSRSYLHL